MRSPLTEKFLRIVALRDEVKTWPQDEQDFFLDMLAPEPQSVKPAMKVTTKRKIERCEVCNYTRRAIHHNNHEHTDYHEFVLTEKSSKKSSTSKPATKSERASGMATVLNRNLKQRRPSDGSVSTEGLCGFQYHDETFCDEPYLNRIHAADGGYAGYHPFQPSTTAPPAPASSPANGGATSSTQSLEASAASAGAATGGLSE